MSPLRTRSSSREQRSRADRAESCAHPDVIELPGAETVSIQEHTLGFTAASPEAWLAEQEEHHPLWRWIRPQLTAERWAELRAEGGAALTEANEDSTAFLTTSSYLVVTARR